MQESNNSSYKSYKASIVRNLVLVYLITPQLFIKGTTLLPYRLQDERY